MATPAQIAALTPEDIEVGRRVEHMRRVESARKQAQSAKSAARNTSKAGRKGLEQLARGATSMPARLAGGLGLALYPSELGAGTLDSPEARRAMQQNALKTTQMPGMAWAERGQPGSDVPFLVRPGLSPSERAAEIERQAAAVRKQVAPEVDPASASAVPGGPPRTTSDWDMNEHIARSQPDFEKKRALAATLRDLREEGFAPVSALPGGIDPRSGNPWLGPNQIMIRERLGTPEDYTAALQAREAAMARGQAAGMPQSAIGGDYRPSEATRMYAEKGGPITEYVVPGKGTATFLGERQGGGTLSVVGGRTPEEQALIDQRVAGIDSQTAAMRDLRNAQRQAQGLPTVEQTEQMAAMQRLTPAPPSTRDLDLQEAELMRQLQGAGDIRGFGSRRRRADAIQAAQTGLAAIANQRQALNQGYQAQLAQTQGLMGLQASERQKAIEAQLRQRAAEQAQQQWQAEFDQSDRQKAQELAVRAFGQQARNQPRPAMLSEKAISDILTRYSTPAVAPGQPATVNLEGLHGDFNVAPLPENPAQMQVGQVYYDPSDPASPYKIATPQGMARLGGRRDLIIYSHMTNPAAQGGLELSTVSQRYGG